MRPKYEPDSPPPVSPPDDMNTHLSPTWWRVRGEIVGDQNGIHRNLEVIRECKKSLRFLKTRVIINKTALDVLGEIKEPRNGSA